MNPVTADANSKLRETRAAGQATSRSRSFFFKIADGDGAGFYPIYFERQSEQSEAINRT